MKKLLCVLVSLFIFFNFCFADMVEIKNTRDYLISIVKEPRVSSIGGEWTVLGIARYEDNLNYFESYYKNLENILKNSGGIINDRKYTDYSRVVIALSAINKNPENVNGYNLLQKTEDYDAVTKQGINGAIFALIALDCKNYKISNNECRVKYVEYILSKQLDDGGFTLNGTDSSIDITAMAVQALSNYIDDSKVNEAVEKALNYLSNAQQNYGGYDTLESTAQVIVALCEMGMDSNERKFVKNNKNLVDGLMLYSLTDGSFKHSLQDKNGNLMSTEQAFYALVAYNRYLNNENSLYDMTDIVNEKSAIILSPADLLKYIFSILDGN